MSLYLQGGGSYPNTKIMDKLFFNSLDKSKKILYIPTAMMGIYSYEDCYIYLSDMIKSLGFAFVVDSFPNLDQLMDVDLSQYGGIYIGGGNTFKLLYEIRKNGVDNKIINFLEKGGSVCGGSAGAIIFGNNINTASDANIVGLKEVYGLDMVNGVSIWCHYHEAHEKQIRDYINHNGTDVIALPETVGLKISNDGIVVIGEGTAIQYGNNYKKFFGVGEYIG